jgi:hypothetical protein
MWKHRLPKDDKEGPCSMYWLARDTIVSVAAQKSGGLSVQPMGITKGKATRGSSPAQFEEIFFSHRDAVKTIREINLQQINRAVVFIRGTIKPTQQAHNSS